MAAMAGKSNKQYAAVKGAKQGGHGQGSQDSLPEIGHKFSSWAKEEQNLNELDELLMEHDLLNDGGPAKQPNRSGISATIHVTRQNGTQSPDQFDFEDVIDEFGDGIEAGGGDLEDGARRNSESKKH